MFLTVTSEKRTHPEAMEKRCRMIFRTINRDLYGRRWEARDGGLRWVLGIERHKSGNPHAHALAWAPGCDLSDPEVFSRREWQDYATWTGGWCKVEQVRSASDTLAYVTKYVLKDGEISLSENLHASAAAAAEARHDRAHGIAVRRFNEAQGSFLPGFTGVSPSPAGAGRRGSVAVPRAAGRCPPMGGLPGEDREIDMRGDAAAQSFASRLVADAFGSRRWR